MAGKTALAPTATHTAVRKINHKGAGWESGQKHLFVPGDAIELTAGEAKKLSALGAVKAGAPQPKGK
jgi:hypothetical protein